MNSYKGGLTFYVSSEVWLYVLRHDVVVAIVTDRAHGRQRMSVARLIILFVNGLILLSDSLIPLVVGVVRQLCSDTEISVFVNRSIASDLVVLNKVSARLVGTGV